MGDDECFHICASEIVADSADAAQFKKELSPTYRVGVISEGENFIETDAKIAGRACKGDS